jgi:hypothetical protein
MPTAVNGQLFYSQDEVQAGLPQYHAALRQATGYTGQFSADPTQKFQQYISGATPEQQAASNALANIYGSGSFAPGTKPKVVPPNQGSERPGGDDIGRSGGSLCVRPADIGRSGGSLCVISSDRRRAGYRPGPPDLAGAECLVAAARRHEHRRPQLGREPRQKPMDCAADRLRR